MVYDLLIYDSKNLADAFDIDHNLIRVNGLSLAEADGIAYILMEHGASVCLLPCRE